MNLVNDAWIPVLDKAGNAGLVSLNEVLSRGEEYRDLAVRPHERVALMRLLLCIMHAALDGPPKEDWERVPELLPEAIAAYWKQWQDSFELFHAQKPFLQIPNLKAASKKNSLSESEQDDNSPIAKTTKLDFALATGSNSTLFDHDAMQAVRKIPPERLAILLISYQNFSPGGLIGSVLWGSTPTPRTSSDAPCVVGSMLHTFWRGKNLLETLHLNLCHKEAVVQRFGDRNEDIWGRPLWEMPPKGPHDTEALHNATHTYLGRLVPLSRLILLHDDGISMLLGAGPVYPNYNNPKAPFVAEPTATVVLSGKKENKVLLRVNPQKALWRDLHALLAYKKEEKQGFWAIQSINTKSEDCHDVMMCGMSRDQADVVDILESVYHIPPQMLQEQGRMIYESGVLEAEEWAQRLGWAVELYRSATDGGWQGKLKSAGAKKGDLLALLRQKAFTHYWSSVENHLFLLMDCVRHSGTDGLDMAQERWKKTLIRIAREGYRLNCAPQTPRQHKAYALGQRAFWQKKNTKNSEQSGEE